MTIPDTIDFQSEEWRLLQKARQIVKDTLDPHDHGKCDCRVQIDAGEWDKGQKVRIALAAIKEGRKHG